MQGRRTDRVNRGEFTFYKGGADPARNRGIGMGFRWRDRIAADFN